MTENVQTASVAVVTGGAAGIGEAVSLLLARAGATVVALDRDRVALDTLAATALSEGLAIEAEHTDVSDGDQVAAVAARVWDRHGGVATLVCAAGIQRYGTVDQAGLEQFDEIMNVNVRGVFATCHHFIPLIRARGGGSIVVVASVQAYATQAGVAAYAASKGALVSLVKAMAVDYAGEGIRVNAVCPGSVDTPMLRWAAERFADGRSPSDLVADWGRAHPLGRVADAAEVARAVAYLAGPDASFVTGADLRVDGGLTATLNVAIPD